MLKTGLFHEGESTESKMTHFQAKKISRTLEVFCFQNYIFYQFTNWFFTSAYHHDSDCIILFSTQSQQASFLCLSLFFNLTNTTHFFWNSKIAFKLGWKEKQVCQLTLSPWMPGLWFDFKWKGLTIHCQRKTSANNFFDTNTSHFSQCLQLLVCCCPPEWNVRILQVHGQLSVSFISKLKTLFFLLFSIICAILSTWKWQWQFCEILSISPKIIRVQKCVQMFANTCKVVCKRACESEALSVQILSPRQASGPILLLKLGYAPHRVLKCKLRSSAKGASGTRAWKVNAQNKANNLKVLLP